MALEQCYPCERIALGWSQTSGSLIVWLWIIHRSEAWEIRLPSREIASPKPDVQPPLVWVAVAFNNAQRDNPTTLGQEVEKDERCQQELWGDPK